jgi:hypothetical protein
MWIIDDPAGGPIPVIKSRICLLPMIDARIWALFRLYSYYEKGVLLKAGGLADQPNQYLESMELIAEANANG